MLPKCTTTLNSISFTDLLKRWPGAKADLINYLIVSNELTAYLEKNHCENNNNENKKAYIPAIVTSKGGVISGTSTVVFNVTDVEFVEQHYPYVTTPLSKNISKSKDNAQSNAQVQSRVEIVKKHEASSKPKKKYIKSDITLKIAALLCGVSQSTIRNWERGERLPIGIPYPGRLNCLEFKKFAITYQGTKRTKQQALAIERAQSRDPQVMAEEEHEQTVWDS